METPSLETGMICCFLFQIVIPMSLKQGNVVLSLQRRPEISSISNRTLNAPALDDANFGLHFAKWHIKLHRVLKSQFWLWSFHFLVTWTKSFYSLYLWHNVATLWKKCWSELLYRPCCSAVRDSKLAHVSLYFVIIIIIFCCCMKWVLRMIWHKISAPIWEGRAFQTLRLLLDLVMWSRKAISWGTPLICF